jgi:large subunit ribosomal protein L32
MGLPAKRRTSRSKRERNAHAFLVGKTTTVCDSCKAEILPHRACPFCGNYKGKKALNTEKRVERMMRKAKKA